MLGLGLGLNKSNVKVPGLLEQYKSSIVMGFSYYKLFASSRLCVRVRRSSDNAQRDFGFVGNYIDVAGILSFCGAGSGFVSIWYNQFVGGNHAVQNVNGNQPRIVNNGVFEGDGVYFNRTNSNHLICLNYTQIDIITPPLCTYLNFKNYDTIANIVFTKSTLTNVQYRNITNSTYYEFALSTYPLTRDINIGNNKIRSYWNNKLSNGVEIEQNGVTLGTKSIDLINSGTNVWLGGRDSLTAFFLGNIKTTIVGINNITYQQLIKV